MVSGRPLWTSPEQPRQLAQLASSRIRVGSTLMVSGCGGLGNGRHDRQEQCLGVVQAVEKRQACSSSSSQRAVGEVGAKGKGASRKAGPEDGWQLLGEDDDGDDEDDEAEEEDEAVSVETLSKFSVKELKLLLAEAGAEQQRVSACSEKRDLVELLRDEKMKVRRRPKAGPIPAGGFTAGALAQAWKDGDELRYPTRIAVGRDRVQHAFSSDALYYFEPPPVSSAAGQ